MLLAATKFLMSPFLARYAYGYNFYESLLITTVGGLLGVLAFGLIGKIIDQYWARTVDFVKGIFGKKKDPNEKVKIFNRTNRFIVFVKKRLGLVGVALITPCIISIPIGTIVAFAMYKHQPKRVWTALSVSLVFWSVILNLVAQFTGIRL